MSTLWLEELFSILRHFEPVQIDELLAKPCLRNVVGAEEINIVKIELRINVRFCGSGKSILRRLVGRVDVSETSVSLLCAARVSMAI